MDSWGENAQEVFCKPHLVGVTRELDRARFGSWVGVLFDHHPPRLGFSRKEQRLLLSAIPGKTDEDLCEELSVAASTVKNMWRSIYDRAASNLPEVFSEHLAEDAQNTERGKEKKRRLLAYLREHPEELRPRSRRLLRTRA
jgi:hypothetical protein